MDVGDGEWVPAVYAKLGLAVVDGGADVVDGDVVGGDESGEVEELVEVALGWEGDHHHYYLAWPVLVGHGHCKGVESEGCN